jgi:hypothetical protein
MPTNPFDKNLKKLNLYITRIVPNTYKISRQIKIGQNAVIFCLEVKERKASQNKQFLAFYS